MIRLLENEQARGQLIERLRVVSANSTPTTPLLGEPTFAGALALHTSNAIEGAAQLFGTMTRLGDRIVQVLTGATTIDAQALRAAVLDVALVVVATMAAYWALQVVCRRPRRAFAEGAASGGLARRLKSRAMAGGLDVAGVLLAWGAGYLFALGVGGGTQIGISQSLFLNAFLLVELNKTGLRIALAPRWPTLRVVPLDDTVAAYWQFWLGRLVSLLGYAFLFVAPLLATEESAEVAEAFRIIVLCVALALAVTIIQQNRDAVRARLMCRAEAGRFGAVGRPLVVLARLWHVVAIGYLVVVFVLWLADPEGALPFVLGATGQSGVAIAMGALLATLVTRLASGGMRLPEDIKARLPLLENRLNAFVPTILKIVRVLVTFVVVMTIGQAWHVTDFAGWLSGDTGQRALTSLISVALILLGGGVIYLAVQSWIEYRLNASDRRVPGIRERTLLGLFRNAFSILLGVQMFMLVLSELGVDIGPLLAGAGVIGLAIGFGAQKLVQDVINGAFIQFEDTMNEGDEVTAGGITGTIERLTIRSVSLRSLDGAYHVIPFSSVDTVSNFTKHFSYHVASIGVGYGENLVTVKEAMVEAFERLKRTSFSADVIGEFDMHGVVEFGQSAIVVRARIKTAPGKHASVGRAYNEIVKEVFDERSIEIPFPHLTLQLAGQKKAPRQPAAEQHSELLREALQHAAQAGR